MSIILGMNQLPIGILKFVEKSKKNFYKNDEN